MSAPSTDRPAAARTSRTRVRLLKASIIEYLLFDSWISRRLIGLAGVVSGFTLFYFGRRQRGLAMLGRVHRSAFSWWSTRRVDAFVRTQVASLCEEADGPMAAVLRSHVELTHPTPATAGYFLDPNRLLDGTSIVLKSSKSSERGVLLLYYSYTYPLFWKFFDMEAIARRYLLAIEPSWSGFCDPDVLLFTLLRDPVFVGATEPRDREFIQGLKANLIPAPFSSNTWTDHRCLPSAGGRHEGP